MLLTKNTILFVGKKVQPDEMHKSNINAIETLEIFEHST